MQLIINNLKKILQAPLPGEAVQLQMAPSNRPAIKIESLNPLDYKHSAVMVVLCKDEDDDFFIPLIERETYNGTHSGQISLPGGKFEIEDITLEKTAKRECFEEIGLQTKEVLGKLTAVYIPVSGFLVQPFFGHYLITQPNFVKHQREVKTILKLKINDLLNDSFIKYGSLSDSANMKHPYFEINNYKIWGATAMILNEVKFLLKNSF